MCIFFMHIGKKQTVDLFNKGAFKLDTLEFRIHSSYRYKRYHYFLVIYIIMIFYNGEFDPGSG